MHCSPFMPFVLGTKIIRYRGIYICMLGQLCFNVPAGNIIWQRCGGITADLYPTWTLVHRDHWPLNLRGPNIVLHGLTNTVQVLCYCRVAQERPHCDFFTLALYLIHQVDYVWPLRNKLLSGLWENVYKFCLVTINTLCNTFIMRVMSLLPYYHRNIVIMLVKLWVFIDTVPICIT